MALERGILGRNQGRPRRGGGLGAVPRPGDSGRVGMALASRRRHEQGRAPRRQRRRCGRRHQEGRLACAVHGQIGEAVQLGSVRVGRARSRRGARPPALVARRRTKPVLGRLVLWHLLDSVHPHTRERREEKAVGESGASRNRGWASRSSLSCIRLALPRERPLLP